MSEPAQHPHGRVKPTIFSVLDLSSGEYDQFTPGGTFVVRGRGFGELPDPPRNLGVYIHGPGAALQRIEHYERWSDREIRACWPGTITGSLWLFVEACEADHEVQSAIHCTPLMLGRGS
ncbi:MAG: hypothetical protein ABMA13_22125 [Chthoniobacteraceae bacterium]